MASARRALFFRGAALAGIAACFLLHAVHAGSDTRDGADHARAERVSIEEGHCPPGTRNHSYSWLSPKHVLDRSLAYGVRWILACIF